MCCREWRRTRWRGRTARGGRSMCRACARRALPRVSGRVSKARLRPSLPVCAPGCRRTPASAGRPAANRLHGSRRGLGEAPAPDRVGASVWRATRGGRPDRGRPGPAPAPTDRVPVPAAAVARVAGPPATTATSVNSRAGSVCCVTVSPRGVASCPGAGGGGRERSASESARWGCRRGVCPPAGGPEVQRRRAGMPVRRGQAPRRRRRRTARQRSAGTAVCLIPEASCAWSGPVKRRKRTATSCPSPRNNRRAAPGDPAPQDPPAWCLSAGGRGGAGRVCCGA